MYLFYFVKIGVPLKFKELSVSWLVLTTAAGNGTYPNGSENFCPSVIAQDKKSTIDFAFSLVMLGFALRSLYNIM